MRKDMGVDALGLYTSKLKSKWKRKQSGENQKHLRAGDDEGV